VFVHLRFPGHEHVKIKDGVPEGWEKTIIGETSSFLSRGITPKYDEEAKGVVINQKCVRDRMLTLNLSRKQSKPVPPDKLIQFGDVLVNSTGTGTLGRVAQCLQHLENTTVDSHLTIVRPKTNIPIHYFGLQLTGLESYIATLGRGATNQTELSKDAVAEIPIVIPPYSITKVFEDIAAPIFREIKLLNEQNQKLREARDLLLPRLMNGEIVV
jgi:type I restriction enzyme S subunit